MQGCLRFRLYFLTVTITAALLTGTGGAGRAEGGSRVVGSGLPETSGLVLDARGYAYTMNREDGTVLCLPPDGKPMVYARVDGPTALAVDRLRTLFVGTASGDIFAVTPDGAVSRVFRCGSQVSGLSIDRDGNLLAATAKGAVLRLAREDFRFSD
jgi:sugar lactone lactonase YvrE